MNAGKPKFCLLPRWRGLGIATDALYVAIDAGISLRCRSADERSEGHAGRRGGRGEAHAGIMPRSPRLTTTNRRLKYANPDVLGR